MASSPGHLDRLFRHRFRLSSFRSRSRGTSAEPKTRSSPATLLDRTAAVDLTSPVADTSSPDAPSLHLTVDPLGVSNQRRGDGADAEGSAATLHVDAHREMHVALPLLGESTEGTASCVDLWSAAFQEAVDAFGENLDSAIMQGKSVETLLKSLEATDDDKHRESAFVRGVDRLRSAKVPLDGLKLALDLASPLARLNPIATTVFGIVTGATAIAITLASADLTFAKQIGVMLEQISYIDDCDTLGQKLNQTSIHHALVRVYEKILELYQFAFHVLKRSGVKFLINMVLQKDRVPDIIEGFLRRADILHKIVQKETLEITQDIQLMLYDIEISQWLGGGKIVLQGRSHAELRALGADGACEFLLSDHNFIRWYQTSECGQLAIIGDMGCGKTTAMAFLVDELIRRNKHQLPQPKVCYYYCGTDKTGEAVNIFAVLILSVLQQFRGLKKTFHNWYKQHQMSGNLEPATDGRQLAEFLSSVLESLDRPIYILIDGLDECDRTSRTMILNLLSTSTQRNSRVKTLVATRREDQIMEQLDAVATINVAPDVERDCIIVEHLVASELSHLSEDVKALIRRSLGTSARGSAIWTKMVIELIGIRAIRAYHPMQRFLEDLTLPGNLAGLYQDLFAKCTSGDLENQYLAGTALEVLAVARRPLSILELTWAATLATLGREVKSIDALARLVDHERLLYLIRPFISRIEFTDMKRRQVRLVHQSVKEYIIHHRTSDLSGSQPSAQETGISFTHQRIERLESGLLEICMKYLLLDDINVIQIFSDEQLATDALPQEIDLFEPHYGTVEYDPYCTWEDWEASMIRYDPTLRGLGEFFVYASCHWTEHFNAIKHSPFPNLDNIEKLCEAGSTRLHNWIQQNCRPGCAMKSRFLFESSLYDPLSITSLYGSDGMLDHMVANSDFKTDHFLPKPALRAADQILQWGDLAKLKILFLGEELSHQVQNLEFFQLVIIRWSGFNVPDRDWDAVFDLTFQMIDIMMREHWANELLCIAARAGCIPIIDRLMVEARRNDELRNQLFAVNLRTASFTESRKRTHQSIGAAVLGNHIEIVSYLLLQDGIQAHLEFVNQSRENVLHLAAKPSNPALLGLLAPRLQNRVHDVDKDGQTPLARVVLSSAGLQDRLECAKILLSKSNSSLEMDYRDDEQHPLRVAVQLGDVDMCRLLLDIGNMSPLIALARGEGGQLVLKDKSLGTAESMLEMLQMLGTGDRN